MTTFCAEHGVKLLPYGVLAGGLLSDRYLGVPASQVKFDTYSKQKYASVIQQGGGWKWFQELLSVLSEIADSKGSTIANVASAWVLARPQVVGILIGARNADHVQDHQAISRVSLETGDLDKIAAVLDKGVKPQGDCYDWERGTGPF